MDINGIHLFSFSPCGHTREYGTQIAFGLRQCLPDATFEERDVTPLSAQERRYFLASSSLVVLCAPVFGGRVPTPAVARFANLEARESPAILLVTYGNRAYDDALLELVAIARNQGFNPVGAAACIAQHTLAPECAADRPNAADAESARDFGREIAGVITSGAFSKSAALGVPGNPELRQYTPAPLPQQITANCIMCGQCWSKCPTGAITPYFPAQVNMKACIACMGCISICPTGGRIPDAKFLEAVQNRIRPLCAVPKNNEYFII